MATLSVAGEPGLTQASMSRGQVDTRGVGVTLPARQRAEISVCT